MKQVMKQVMKELMKQVMKQYETSYETTYETIHRDLGKFYLLFAIPWLHCCDTRYHYFSYLCSNKKNRIPIMLIENWIYKEL